MWFFRKKAKVPNVLAGLYQALGVIIYCGLISGLFYFASTSKIQPQVFLMTSAMLLLLVFSVAVMGLVIFGYPIYLVFEKKSKTAIKVLFWNLLFLVGFGALFLLFLMIFQS